MFAIASSRKIALAAGCVPILIASLAIVRSQSGSVSASTPHVAPTTISAATAGPVLIVTNTGTKGTSAILGVVDSASVLNGNVPTAVVGSATGTTGTEYGVSGFTTTPLGAGVSGVGVNTGVYGRGSGTGSVGVVGTAIGDGLYGTATGTSGSGVYGGENAANSSAVYGDETYPAFVPPTPLATFPPDTETTGLHGIAADGVGVQGITTYPYVNSDEPAGVQGLDTATKPTANDGVFGLTTNGNAGVYGLGQGTGKNNPDVGPSTGVVGAGPVGVAGFTSATAPPATSTAAPTSAVIADVPYGAASTNKYYEYLALGTSYQKVFSVDQSGNVSYSGTLTAAHDVGNGIRSERTVAEVARPTLEDVGEAALRAGAAYVPLDPSFTASMETRAPYMVFVTPGGEANQLYVTGKTPQGFWVRETRGNASIPFDYRIVAYPKGDTQRRIALRPEDATAGIPYIDRRAREMAAIAPFLSRRR
jgi:hypothetical protein